MAAIKARRNDLAAAQIPDSVEPSTAAVETAIDEAFLDGFRVAMAIGAGLAWSLVVGQPAE